MPTIKVIGKYEVGKTIGEGSFGKVKLATDTLTDTLCAVKIIDRDIMQADDEIAGQINREIAVMKMLKHPNIVQLREVMSSSSKLYLVVELCSGGELFDIVLGDSQGRYKPNEVRQNFEARSILFRLIDIPSRPQRALLRALPLFVALDACHALKHAHA